MADRFVLLMQDAKFFFTAEEAHAALDEFAKDLPVRVHMVDDAPVERPAPPAPKDYVIVYESSGNVYDGQRRTLADADDAVSEYSRITDVEVMVMRLVPANDTP